MTVLGKMAPLSEWEGFGIFPTVAWNDCYTASFFGGDQHLDWCVNFL
jgi:hypothetical protein